MLLALLALWLADLDGVFRSPLSHPAIHYNAPAPNNVVAQLNRRLEGGEVQLKPEPVSGYLRSVLAALDVPIESQMAVFSKTSLMAQLIHPQNPRTIFFNDSVAVAWVRGEPFVEIAAEDPEQGVIFYTLDQRQSERPRLQRRDDCLHCHESYATLGVPGMLLRSVFPAPNGAPMRELGDFNTDHRSPLEQRWGGWFVTGRIGATNMGNMIMRQDDHPQTIAARVDTPDHLSPHSDVVALMVFEHQMHMINLLTRIGWEVRVAMHEQRDTHPLIRETARELVDYMLFVDEAPLGGKIEGSSGFAEKFAKQGPTDRRGRSLRQLDLEQRLMRYPCSYMIYSPAFDALPAPAKSAIYDCLWQVLSGKEKDAKYTRLTAADRTAIIEILRDTKKGLPQVFLNS